MNYLTIVSEIIILMIYISIGYIVRKIRLVSEKGINDISKIVVNVALPLLVINSMIIEYKQEYVTNLIHMALGAFLFIAFATLISHFVTRRVDAKSEQKTTMRFCMIVGNTAFLGYPLCFALFGSIGVLYASIYLAIQNLFTWTFGVSMLKQERLKLSNLKNLISPGIIGIVTGLTMFFLNIQPSTILSRIINDIGGITIPLALMMIGANLYGYHLIEIIKEKDILIVVFMKTFILPMIFLGVICFLPISPIIKAIITIQVASPVQASSCVYAKNFGGDSVVAAKSVFLSTIACLITIPIFLLLN